MNRRHLAALLLAPVLPLTACGGDGGTEPGPTPPAQPAGGAPSSAPGGDGLGGPARGGAGKPPAGAPPSAPSAPAEVVDAFVACMRKEGVKVPEDTSTWHPDPGDGRTQKALLKCVKERRAP